MSEHNPNARREHSLRLPLPWKGIYYFVNCDAFLRGRKSLMFIWYFDYGCTFVRIGWVYRFDKHEIKE